MKISTTPMQLYYMKILNNFIDAAKQPSRKNQDLILNPQN